MTGFLPLAIVIVIAICLTVAAFMLTACSMAANGRAQSPLEAAGLIGEGARQGSSRLIRSDHLNELGVPLKLSPTSVQLCKDTGSMSMFSKLETQDGSLLLQRMAILGLDPERLSREEPSAFRDLKNNCIICVEQRSCIRDLLRDIEDPAAVNWKE